MARSALMSAVPARSPITRGRVLSLVLASAGLLLWSAAAPWLSVTERKPSAFAGTQSLVGRDISTALGVTPLLAVVLVIAGIVATARWLRVTAAVVALVASIAGGQTLATMLAGRSVLVVSVSASNNPGVLRPHGFAIAAGCVGLVALLTGSALTMRGASVWRGMSTRYQRSSRRATSAESDSSMPWDEHEGPLNPLTAWQELDAGRDPTDGAPDAGGTSSSSRG